MNATLDETASAGLTSQSRRALRARAHALKPVVWIAQDGASASVLKEIDRALAAHELVKIHAAVDGRDERELLLAGICAELAAQPVQVIGKMLIAFRARPPAPAAAPSKPRRVARARKAGPSGGTKSTKGTKAAKGTKRGGAQRPPQRAARRAPRRSPRRSPR